MTREPRGDGLLWRARAATLVLAGALLLHEARYAIAGLHSDAAAHAYLSWFGPLVCGALVLAVAEFFLGLRRRRGDGDWAERAGTGARWLAFSAVLLATFAVQEVAETLVAHGRFEPADSLVAHGGWLALPLAVSIGAVVALLLRGARALVRRAGASPLPPCATPLPVSGTRAGHSRRRNVLAGHLAGRGPPLLS